MLNSKACILNLKTYQKTNSLVLYHFLIWKMFSKIYKTLVLDLPKISLAIVSLILIYFLYYSKDFKLDASSDSLLLESDKDLKYLREVNDRYGSKDYLVLTYTPLSSFSDEETIINLQFLKSKIEKLNWVDGVITIIDVPLLKAVMSL